VITTVLALARLARGLIRALRDPETRGVVLVTALLIAAGTIFYSRSQGWSVVDSLYFSVSTLTTVGYGDLTPHGAGAKLFTVVYILTGIGAVSALIGIFARNVMRTPGTRRRDKDQDH
jgi:voltage-gated potassium channel